MKYRPHRGSLADSMAEVIEIDGRARLIDHLRKDFAPWPDLDGRAEQIKIAPYGGDDDRIGWRNVHIITLDGYGVVGFCEGPAT